MGTAAENLNLDIKHNVDVTGVVSAAQRAAGTVVTSIPQVAPPDPPPSAPGTSPD